MNCGNCGYNAPEGGAVCPACGQALSRVAEPGKRRDWFSRNAKWAVPVGCLGALLLFALFVGGIFMLVFSMFRNSEPYQQALERARQSPAVQQAVGTPIEPGWLTTGSYNESGPSGSADFAISIQGPKGKATLYVDARKEAGKWTFRMLRVDTEAGLQIDLLKQETREAPTTF